MSALKVFVVCFVTGIGSVKRLKKIAVERVCCGEEITIVRENVLKLWLKEPKVLSLFHFE